jgi:hypothetical protein
VVIKVVAAFFLNSGNGKTAKNENRKRATTAKRQKRQKKAAKRQTAKRQIKKNLYIIKKIYT